MDLAAATAHHAVMNRPEDRKREAPIEEQSLDTRTAWGRAIWLPAGAAVAGVIASIVYATQFSASKFLSVFATSLIVMCASAVAGAVLGFLFGIPRARRVEEGATSSGAPLAETSTVNRSEAERKPATRPNSNLDDISDWLTKILVGVGLTQLGAIGGALGNLSRGLGPSLGGAESSTAFALALVVTFTATGFLVGYLWTRFYLPELLERAESSVQRELSRRVQELGLEFSRDMEATSRALGQTIGDSEQRKAPPPPEASSEEIQKRLRDHASNFNEVYGSMESGPTRTAEMSRIVSHIRGLARSNGLPPNAIRELFDKNDRGSRVVALAWLTEKPNPGLVNLVLSGIQDSKSAFEQYQALRAAEVLVPQLDGEDRKKLRTAIEDQMEPGRDKFITRDSDRWTLAENILRLLT
jgi:hypothetical protein